MSGEIRRAADSDLEKRRFFKDKQVQRIRKTLEEAKEREETLKLDAWERNEFPDAEKFKPTPPPGPPPGFPTKPADMSDEMWDHLNRGPQEKKR